MNSFNWFTAKSPENASNSIVVSFSSHWEEQLFSRYISLVFRRRVPISFEAKRLYVYLGSPRSHIIGVANINCVEFFSIESALRNLDYAAISREELNNYFRGYEEIGGYRLSKIDFFMSTLTFPYLNAETGFVPPQSFLRVSAEADRWLMKHSLEK